MFKLFGMGLAGLFAIFLMMPIGGLAAVWFYFYGQTWLRASAGPPPDAFPGSVASVDGEGNLSWWGCIKLPSGDVREVGNPGERALFFMPGGACKREVELQDTADRIYPTWAAHIEEEPNPYNGLVLVVANTCPASIGPAAREEASRLIQEYLSRSDSQPRYRADSEMALRQIAALQGPTSEILEDDPLRYRTADQSYIWVLKGQHTRCKATHLTPPPPSSSSLPR